MGSEKMTNILKIRSHLEVSEELFLQIPALR